MKNCLLWQQTLGFSNRFLKKEIIDDTSFRLTPTAALALKGINVHHEWIMYLRELITVSQNFLSPHSLVPIRLVWSLNLKLQTGNDISLSDTCTNAVKWFDFYSSEMAACQRVSARIFSGWKMLYASNKSWIETVLFGTSISEMFFRIHIAELNHNLWIVKQILGKFGRITE